MMDSDKFVTNNMVSITNDMGTVWNGYASSELCLSFETAINEMNNVKQQIVSFDNALALLETYKEKEILIKDYEDKISYEQEHPSLESTEEYIENGQTKSRTVYVVNQSLIDSYRASITTLEQEKQDIRTQIEGIFASITGVEMDESSSTSFSIPAGELSYDDALVLADKLGVPVEYVIGLHLHADYQIGDRLIPEGINPDIIHYAGPNGYPILIGGVEDFGDRYRADAPERGTYFIKMAENNSVVGAGREYNIGGWPITYGEFEGRNTYWTYYGPICQGDVLGMDAAPIQCTSTDLYPCDDGLYRDKDGYIVLAGTPYINQFYQDGQTVNFEANGGLEYEESFVVTPFGLGRFYDHAACKVPDGIYVDFYMNDGYESNNVAQTEAGRKLRENAVSGYESSNLYWQDMIH